MSDAELWASWRLWLIVAVVVVLLAAGLLIAILLTARRILAEAVRALHAVEAVRSNTDAIWALQTTNEVAEEILGAVESIEQKGAALVGALHGQTVGRS
jgi:hypothetical protein